MKYFFILGRNPELSKLEIISFFESRDIYSKQIIFDENLLVLDSSDHVVEADEFHEDDFELDLETEKHLNDIFEEYQSEPGSFSFDKTKVYVKLFTAGTVYISRSQARRLMNNLEKFKVIVLDFEGIKTIGQAFADEVFRVFVTKYPDIEIKSINTNDAELSSIVRKLIFFLSGCGIISSSDLYNRSCNK